MFRIGTFSKLARVSARMLRHYEKCGLFYPLDVDPETGYRIYSAEQIPQIGRIIALRDMGYGTQEIRAILAGDAVFLEHALKQKIAEVEAVIAGENDKLALLGKALRDMKEKRIMANYEVTIKNIPAVQVLSLRDVIPSYSDEGDLWHRMYRALGKSGVSLSTSTGEIYTVYHDSDYKEKDVDVEVCIPWDGEAVELEGIVCRQLEAVPVAACVLSEGPYENMADAIAFVATWIEQNGYEIIGNSHGKGLRHPGNERDSQRFQTEIQFPVRKK